MPRIRSLAVTITATLLGLSAAFGEWALLKDGSVVKVRGKRDREVAIERSDGTRAIIDRAQLDGVLQPIAAIRIVDDVIRKIGEPEHHDEVRKRLKQIGMAAVPQLLVHLKSPRLETRQAAIAALQMAWSKEAQEPVSALLDDEDNYLRRMAMNLVQRHFPEEDRLRLLAPLADSSTDPNLSGPALAAVLGKTPDPKKLASGLEKPAQWAALHHLVPRYHDASIRPWSRRLLEEGGTMAEQRSALIALLYQMDDRPETRKLVSTRLRDKAPELRDMAAEYLRWHGRSTELSALVAQQNLEKDPHTAASIEAAIKAILHRSNTFSQPETSDPPPRIIWPETPAAAYAEAISRLSQAKNLPTRQSVVALLAREPLEPVFEYMEGWKLRPDPRHDRRLDTLSLAFGYPTHAEREQAKHLTRSANALENQVPVTKALQPPIRNYFDPKRKSFGVLVGPGDSPFANSHHVGDDVAFGKQQSTIVAIGDGLVRIAQIGMPSWGGLVVLEHRLPDGTSFCSLYGHLGPLITVSPGDRVSRGEKLGTLGRDYVFATGGYRSHLHFGIHQGNFHNDGQPWVGGYLAPKRYEDEDSNRWIDPQPFLKTHLASGFD